MQIRVSRSYLMRVKSGTRSLKVICAVPRVLLLALLALPLVVHAQFRYQIEDGGITMKRKDRTVTILPATTMV